jgi:ABC-2 type transport system ATP-binding protein
MIEVRGLSKRFGKTLAVDQLDFDVAPGVLTGFLGPNGAGKSTTMRCILGLDRPSAGQALVNGRPYARATHPMHEVGALLDAKDVHKGRTARMHLLTLAQSNGIPSRRVDEVLDLVGLSNVAGKRIKGFSLGMSQRLGIAATMLGNPGVLMFDEPVNGLDPEGIAWIRNFMKSLAGEGRTVLVSSHLMSEMALTAQHLIVIGRGRLIADMSVNEFIAASSGNTVRVRSPQLAALRDAIAATGHQVNEADGYLDVQGLSTDEVGDLAAHHRITIHELFLEKASLESAFMELTRDSVEYHAPSDGPPSEADRPVTQEVLS